MTLPQPYFSRDNVTLYHGDCREILPLLPKVDLVLTDPPYGIHACDRSDGGVGSIVSGSKFYGRQQWDHEKPDEATIAAAIDSGHQAVVWGGNYFRMSPSSCWLVWDKMQREFSFADGEMAWTNFDKAVRMFSYSRGQLTADGKVHPTQKPIALMKWCIGLADDPQTILDPFAGSGTTLRAVMDLGRKAIGIEISEAYCEIAAKRLEQKNLQFGDTL